MTESLVHLTDTLKRNEAERSRLEQTREEWITGVSHDLRTPLSSIKGYAHMLEADGYEWTPQEIQGCAAVMLNKAIYMDRLIEDLNMTYRLKNESQPLTLERTEMNEFIRRIIIQFVNNPLYVKTPISFVDAGNEIYFEIDKKWFTRVIENLFANAIKHNPEGTHVEVAVKKDENARLLVTIRDDGIGMDEETVQKLFNRSYRGTNTEESSGTGLGLAISKQLVLAHGGSIDVNSTVGVGTEIVLSFQLKI